MKIIIASDSFKESLSSKEVNDTLEKGVLEIFPEAEIKKIQVADGGEGTIDCIKEQKDCRIFEETVQGPLSDIKVKANWLLIKDTNEAVIESASAVGLSLLPSEKRNPSITSTYGIGELINAAVNKEAKKIYIGLGGSSTNDAGEGIARALGVKFFDKNGNKIPPGGKALINLAKIDISGINNKMLDVQIICLCDVENTLCGPKGASFVFALQKGAMDEDLPLLDKALENFAGIVKKDFNNDILNIKGGGAAGGIAAGLKAFFNTEIKSGIDTILDIINFDEIIKDAGLVLTGEGKIDNQTLFGKAIAGITQRCQKMKIPVMAFCGILSGNKENIMKELGLVDIIPIVDHEISKEDSLQNPQKYLQIRALEAMKWYKEYVTNIC